MSEDVEGQKQGPAGARAVGSDADPSPSAASSDLSPES